MGGLGNGQIRKGVAHVSLQAARSGQSKSGGVTCMYSGVHQTQLADCFLLLCWSHYWNN